jgi:hypothetical protein
MNSFFEAWWQALHDAVSLSKVATNPFAFFA